MLTSALRAFARDTRAVGAVEFAISLPFVVFLMVGGYETANYVRASLRVETAANAIAEMLSQAKADPNAQASGDGLVTQSQLHFFRNSMIYTLPDAQTEATQTGQDWTQLAAVSYWSVKFKPNAANCGANCVYTPVVVWSYNHGPACDAQIQSVADDATVTPTTLPQSVYGPGSLMVVQVTYKYYPTFGANIFGPSTITRTALMAPRNVPLVELSDSADNAATCAGVL